MDQHTLDPTAEPPVKVWVAMGRYRPLLWWFAEADIPREGHFDPIYEYALVGKKT